MGTLTMVMHDDFIKQLDQAIKESKMYSSRSEFLKDAVREKWKELEDRKKRVEKIQKGLHELGEKALAKGWTGEMPSKEQREKLLREFEQRKKMVKSRWA